LQGTAGHWVLYANWTCMCAQLLGTLSQRGVSGQWFQWIVAEALVNHGTSP